MNNPIISWLNKDLIAFGDPSHPEVPNKIQFNDGTYNNPVLADTDSEEVVFYIANNFTKNAPVATDCFDIKNCSITVKKSEDGSMDEQLVQEKWIRVKVDSLTETEFSPIGANMSGATWVELSKAIGCGDPVVGANNISGLANDGNIAGTGKNNLAKVAAKCHPSLMATPGKHPFKFRIVYTYGTGI